MPSWRTAGCGGISCGCSCPSVGSIHVPQKSLMFSLWEVQKQPYRCCISIDPKHLTCERSAVLAADRIILYLKVESNRNQYPKSA